jgi:ATP-dependent Clp protease ATP-binding subunit ClpX
VNTQTIGFGNSSEHVEGEDLLKYIIPTDVKTFGLIPELVGRFPSLTYLKPLDAAALKRILVEPKNALVKQYIKLFEMDGVKLTFQDDVIDFIVDKAMEYRLGARGLRSICETILNDLMFELPSGKVSEFKLTKEYAQEQFLKDDKFKVKIMA